VSGESGESGEIGESMTSEPSVVLAVAGLSNATATT